MPHPCTPQAITHRPSDTGLSVLERGLPFSSLFFVLLDIFPVFINSEFHATCIDHIYFHIHPEHLPLTPLTSTLTSPHTALHYVPFSFFQEPIDSKLSSPHTIHRSRFNPTKNHILEENSSPTQKPSTLQSSTVKRVCVWRGEVS